MLLRGQITPTGSSTFRGGGGGGGGYTLDQVCSTDTGSSTTSLTCTMGLKTDSGGMSTNSPGCSNMAGCAVASGASVFCITQNTVSPSTITDSSSQTYSHLDALAVHWFQDTWVTYNSAPITTVTINFTFGAGILFCASFTGVASSGADQQSSLDNGFGGGTGSGIAFASGTTGSTTQAAELIINAFCNSTPITVTYHAGTGYTLIDQSPNDANCAIQYKIVAMTGTQTGTGTFDDMTGGHEIMAFVQTFK